jgi:hypothetical protein
LPESSALDDSIEIINLGVGERKNWCNIDFNKVHGIYITLLSVARVKCTQSAAMSIKMLIKEEYCGRGMPILFDHHRV